jgi:hypothetical protein
MKSASPGAKRMARKGGLTAITIKNLAAKDTRYEVPDPACPELYLQVHPSGANSWAYRHRFGGKSRKLTIGVSGSRSWISRYLEPGNAGNRT